SSTIRTRAIAPIGMMGSNIATADTDIPVLLSTIVSPRVDGSGMAGPVWLRLSVLGQLLGDLEHPHGAALVDMVDGLGHLAAPQRHRAAPAAYDGQPLLAVLVPGHRRGDDAGAGVELPQDLTGLVVEGVDVAFRRAGEDQAAGRGQHPA